MHCFGGTQWKASRQPLQDMQTTLTDTRGCSVPAPRASLPSPTRCFSHSRRERRRQRHLQDRWALLHPAAASSGALGAADLPPEQPDAFIEGVDVFPRLREGDVYKRLGVTREASFEEVQDARNFLYETYRAHEASREAIELAFDAILQEKMKVRAKFGFRPPRTGRKTNAAGDQLPVGIIANIRERLEPSVPSTTIVNDGSIFAVLGLWAGWQSAAADPTLPLGAAVAFSVWRFFDKRRKRNPDGPFWGNSPVWGAVASTILGLFFGFVISWALVRFTPLAGLIPGRPEALGLFIICLTVGATCIFVR